MQKKRCIIKTIQRKETKSLKTAKLIIGILSIVLSVIVLLQSCAVGVGNALADSEEASGQAGIIVAVVMLIAGIVGITTRSSKGGGITTGIFFLFAALMGYANIGSYSDLGLWSALCLIFGLVFLIGSIAMKKKTAPILQVQQPVSPYPQTQQPVSPYPQTQTQTQTQTQAQQRTYPNPQQRAYPNPQQQTNPNQNPQNRPPQY